MKNFRPVFRHFFYEKFADPGDWYTKRLAYTRSLASSSIGGSDFLLFFIRLFGSIACCNLTSELPSSTRFAKCTSNTIKSHFFFFHPSILRLTYDETII